MDSSPPYSSGLNYTQPQPIRSSSDPMDQQSQGYHHFPRFPYSNEPESYSNTPAPSQNAPERRPRSSLSRPRSSSSMSSKPSHKVSPPLKNRSTKDSTGDPTLRQRTFIACDQCRERKTKCSGETSGCARCGNRGLPCVYSTRDIRTRMHIDPKTQSRLRHAVSMDMRLAARLYGTGAVSGHLRHGGQKSAGHSRSSSFVEDPNYPVPPMPNEVVFDPHRHHRQRAMSGWNAARNAGWAPEMPAPIDIPPMPTTVDLPFNHFQVYNHAGNVMPLQDQYCTVPNGAFNFERASEPNWEYYSDGRNSSGPASATSYHFVFPTTTLPPVIHTNEPFHGFNPHVSVAEEHLSAIGGHNEMMQPHFEPVSHSMEAKVPRTFFMNQDGTTESMMVFDQGMDLHDHLKPAGHPELFRSPEMYVI